MATDAFDRPTEGELGDGSRRAREIASAEPDHSMFLDFRRREKHVRLALEFMCDFALYGRDASGGRGDGWRDASQRGDDVVPQRRPEARAIGVGRVGCPGNARVTADRFGVNARDVEHWADQCDARRQAALGRDPGEAARAAPADQTHEERFELVVGVMRGRDEGARVLAGERNKGGVSLAAGDRFEIAAFGLARHACAGELERQPGGQRPGGLKVGSCFERWAEIVQDVSDDEVAPRGREAQGERRGIRARGTRDQGAAIGVTDAPAARKGPPASDDDADGARFWRENRAVGNRRAEIEPRGVHMPMVGF